MKAMKARCFVERGGGVVPLLGVKFNVVRSRTWMDLELLDNVLPELLDTLHPQDVHLVYQAGDETTFFDPSRPGRMLTLRGLQVRVEPKPLCLLQNLETNEVTLGLQFQYWFGGIEWSDGA